MRSYTLTSVSMICVTLVGTSALGAPGLSGLYQVGQLGVVEIAVIEGKVTGKLKKSRACNNVLLDEPVLVGQLEGEVFVGSVTLCQEGPRCEAKRTYPLLAVQREQVLSAFVHLAPGCRSPAAVDDLLRIEPVSSLEPAPPQQPTVTPKPPRGKSEAEAAFVSGSTLLERGEPEAAIEKFLEALETNPDFWAAHEGLGQALIELDRPTEARQHFDQALVVAKSTPNVLSSHVGELHYGRACALALEGKKRDALLSLRTAVDVGGADLMGRARSDPHFASLRNDPGFRRLNSEVLTRKNR